MVDGRSCDRRGALLVLAALALAPCLCGCTSLFGLCQQRVQGGSQLPSPLRTGRARLDRRRRQDGCGKTPDDLTRWWAVFNDPLLDSLICCAYHQNLTLRQVGARVLEARAQLAITTGQIFPQTQNISGSYNKNATSRVTAPGTGVPQQFYSQWNLGFNLAWEVDFWGRFRRAIESSSASLNASVANFDDVLVTLLGDVATNYVQLRTLQERIAFAKANVELLRETLTITEARFRGGTTSELDVYQARSTLEQTEAQIPALEITLRQTANQLCILMGMPPEELGAPAGQGAHPHGPGRGGRRHPRHSARAASRRPSAAVASGRPERPDRRGRGRLLPGHLAQRVDGLLLPVPFASISVAGTHRERWSLVPMEHPELRADPQQRPPAGRHPARARCDLPADRFERRDGSRKRADHLPPFPVGDESPGGRGGRLRQGGPGRPVQYKAGTTDFTRVTQVEQNLVQQQDVLAQDQGQIGTGLIQVYVALGGGWEIRLRGCSAAPLPPPGPSAPPAEPLPVPSPESNMPQPPAA